MEEMGDEAKNKLARSVREQISKANANVIWVGPGNSEENADKGRRGNGQVAEEIGHCRSTVGRHAYGLPSAGIDKGYLYISSGRTFGFWAQMLFLTAFGMLWPTPSDMMTRGKEASEHAAGIGDSDRDGIRAIGVWVRRWIQVAKEDPSLRTRVVIPESRVTGALESLRASDRPGVASNEGAHLRGGWTTNARRRVSCSGSEGC